MKEFNPCIHCVICGRYATNPKHCNEIDCEDYFNANRVVVLPVAFGDVVYQVLPNWEHCYAFCDMECQACQYEQWVVQEFTFNEENWIDVMANLNKRFFLTKEEGEKYIKKHFSEDNE